MRYFLLKRIRNKKRTKTLLSQSLMPLLQEHRRNLRKRNIRR